MSPRCWPASRCPAGTMSRSSPTRLSWAGWPPTHVRGTGLWWRPSRPRQRTRCAPRSASTPGVAVAALARLSAYAQWRRRPEGLVPTLPDVDEDGARALVADALRSGDAHTLSTDQANRLLATFGVRVWPVTPVTSLSEAT